MKKIIFLTFAITISSCALFCAIDTKKCETVVAAIKEEEKLIQSYITGLASTTEAVREVAATKAGEKFVNEDFDITTP